MEAPQHRIDRPVSELPKVRSPMKVKDKSLVKPYTLYLHLHPYDLYKGYSLIQGFWKPWAVWLCRSKSPLLGDSLQPRGSRYIAVKTWATSWVAVQEEINLS